MKKKSEKKQVKSKNENKQEKEGQEIEKVQKSIYFTANAKAHQARDMHEGDSLLPGTLQLLRRHKET